VRHRLLSIPVLYLSRRIVRTKPDYYRLLQAVRDEDAWEAWVVYMLIAVEETVRDAIETTRLIRDALLDVKHRIRERYAFYSQDLINDLFMHPYTKVEFVQNDLGVSRITATKYLGQLVDDGFLEKRKEGRTNYFVNVALSGILTRDAMVVGT